MCFRPAQAVPRGPLSRVCLCTKPSLHHYSGNLSQRQGLACSLSWRPLRKPRDGPSPSEPRCKPCCRDSPLLLALSCKGAAPRRVSPHIVIRAALPWPPPPQPPSKEGQSSTEMEQRISRSVSSHKKPQRGHSVFRSGHPGEIPPVLFHGNDPSAGSPTETLLRLLLPLNDQVRPSSPRTGSTGEPGVPGRIRGSH